MSQGVFEWKKWAMVWVSSTARKAVGLAVACAAFGAAADAQYPTPPQQPQSAPVQMISNQQFDAMMQEGKLLPTGPDVWLTQYIERILQDARNQAVVDLYLLRNRNTPNGVAQLLQPARSQNTHLTPDGNYQSGIPLKDGTTLNVELTGQSSKLSQLASTIIAASDPALKLKLYSNAYTQYTATYTQLCGQSSIGAPGQTDIPLPSQSDGNQGNCVLLTAPSSLVSPASLQGASLAAVNAALYLIVANGKEVLRRAPIIIGAQHPACSAEIGVGDASGADGSGFFGDETVSVGDSPSSTGIYSNFDMPSKKNLTCVKNQGTRGTCHIFAAISAIEYLIARDTGAYVNLNEQDFMEKVKSEWSQDYFNDGGDALDDLNKAQNNAYRFGYENQWDYNPSLSRPLTPNNDFANSCVNYPYPASELGCSLSAPQSPEFCTLRFVGFIPYNQCAFSRVSLASYSPYSSIGGTSIWDTNNTDLSLDYMYLALGFNNAVILAFNATDAFRNTTDGFVAYDPTAFDNIIGGHAVHIIGYVSNEDLAANPNTAFHQAALGGGYFVAKNSWGAGAGDDGYYYLPVNYVRTHATGVYVISGFQQN
jgi:hypothetical protein